MSGNGAWYGGDDQQPAASRTPSYLQEEPFGDEPTAEQPLVPRPVVPQPRTAGDDSLPAGSGNGFPEPAGSGNGADLPPPFPASMYSADGDVADPPPPYPMPSYPSSPEGGSPYPAGSEPYPAGSEPYPAGSEPYPAGSEPYPAGSKPYPAAPQSAGSEPYPAGTDSPTASIPKIGTHSVQLSTIELTTDNDPDAQLNVATETAPAPRNRRDLSAGIAIALVILMVLCIGVAGSSLQVFTQASETFETGTCVAPDSDGRLPYRQVDCTDPAFTHVVVGVVDHDTVRPCRGVPGASTLFSTNATVVCLGVKGVDGSRSINIVRDGDCVNVEGGTALLIDCRDPSAKFQVIKRLTAVPEGTSGPCDGVEGLVETYEWNWTSSDPVDRSDKSVDVVLCLGPSQSALDAEAAARAAQSTCRFLTDAEVSAAVSAATSKTYTVSERVDDGTHCHYQFSKATDTVRVGFFSGAKLNTARGSENFTIDGLRATWDPGRGDRSLGVELPAGTIYIKVQLSGVGDATSRKLAIEAFKSARSRIR